MLENLPVTSIEPYNPIQYLGAKTRIIDSILQAGDKLINNGHVLDLFSGSSVVAQLFYNNGYKVIANDSQNFCGTIAKTFLQTDFSPEDLKFDSEILLSALSEDHIFYRVYNNLIITENNLLGKRDTKNLLKFYKDIPLLWNKIEISDPQINKFLQVARNNYNLSAFQKVPLMSLLYSGTYFGLKQSIELDILRQRLELLGESGEISKWQYNLLLSCLISISSQIVNSAGKHFAQPVKFENIASNELFENRLYVNRRYDVESLLKQSFNKFIEYFEGKAFTSGNLVYSLAMEDLIKLKGNLPQIDLIYADPPYTAQQYSRFYHVPEILDQYRIPVLQQHRGKVTSGIYPDNKFKSRFCSTTQAPSAFSDLFTFVDNSKSNLILSYSESKSKETGNKRMISISEIMKLKSEILPNYSLETINLGLKYKQLNKSELVNIKKMDNEVLLIFKRNS